METSSFHPAPKRPFPMQQRGREASATSAKVDGSESSLGGPEREERNGKTKTGERGEKRPARQFFESSSSCGLVMQCDAVFYVP